MSKASSAPKAFSVVSSPYEGMQDRRLGTYAPRIDRGMAACWLAATVNLEYREGVVDAAKHDHG